MSTAKAALLDSISKPQLRALPTRKASAADRVGRIRDLASSLLNEAETLEHENSLAEINAGVEELTIKSEIDFFDAVRRFEMKLISRALDLAGGNQAQAARMLGLGTTTLNYKIKTYQMLESQRE